MHHVTFTVFDRYSGNAISVVDGYVSDIYTSMVKYGITVITSFNGNAVRCYKTSGVVMNEKALVIQGTTEHVDNMSAVVQEFTDAPIIINASSYED